MHVQPKHRDVGYAAKAYHAHNSTCHDLDVLRSWFCKTVDAKTATPSFQQKQYVLYMSNVCICV